MEETTKQTSMWTKVLWTLVILALVGGFVFVLIVQDNHITKVTNQAQSEIAQKLAYKASLDSAKADVKALSTYRTLTESMNFRDKALKGLTFNIGDVAYTKKDTSRVIIKDRLIGGGNYNFYVTYKILYTNGDTEDITPELLFRQ